MYNEIQQRILQEYQDGEFANLCEPDATEEDLENCGDGLLIFVIHEVADSEDCDSVNEAYKRISRAENDLCDILKIIADGKEIG
ncbi:conserved protein of unknown function [Acidithiobacillus ferrivorans]|uniref:Uncharacterized protein n=1 Tax=Acidithiobacillus ferrivorans TaxID=160808 RepID=A0A060URM7_9PROT|nr:hypothetical protein [Acidithiobacillus ferrivorans]CDQ09229.1 conserved hypothetical protein [Acidithiobacillus ferrivorans]SMH64899.1 conserved protein of unknown function [Acidithiobacillus ferrivorans]